MQNGMSLVPRTHCCMEPYARPGTVLCAGHTGSSQVGPVQIPRDSEKTLGELSSTLRSDLTAPGQPPPAWQLFSSTKHFTARKDFMSFLVLHVPGRHFLPSSHDREWGQSFVLSAATTKPRHSAACSLSTRQMTQTTDAWKFSGKSPGRHGGQRSESFQVRQEPRILFKLFDYLKNFQVHRKDE